MLSGVNEVRSNVELVGEPKLCCESDGENAGALEPPPPPLPPPPCITVAEAAAEEAKFGFEEGVLDCDRGEDTDWDVWACCEPD